MIGCCSDSNYPAFSYSGLSFDYSSFVRNCSVSSNSYFVNISGVDENGFFF
jgi:hypothetical protein